jgi:inorganic triphosphatase YgiF
MVELEAKLLVPDEATFEALGALERIGRLRARVRLERLQQDTYVDTPSLRLYHAGYACRLRHVGHRAFATLKGRGGVDGAVHAREEIEVELDNPSIGALLRLEAAPGPIVRRLAAGEPLTPLFTAVTRRRLWDVGNGARRSLELALDRATFYAETGETGLLEVELESLDGDRALLENAARELRHRYGLTASALSKFERGLRWAGVVLAEPRR